MTPDEARAEIVAAAKSQLGVPYVFGGEDPGVAFDCSGLAQWCCGQAGIAVPRGSADQFDHSGPRVDGALRSGNLVFFYGGEASGPRPGHVGIVVGAGLMIDAPYTGVDVRYDVFSTQPSVGPLDYWGATDPAMLASGSTPVPPGIEIGDEMITLLEVKDAPLGPNGWWTLSGGVAVHVPDPATLAVLQAGASSGTVAQLAGQVSSAWLSQYVPVKATSG